MIKEYNNSVELIEVPLSNKKLVKRFIKVPWYIYTITSASKYWVPPIIHERQEFLNPEKNPFFEHAECRLWIASCDGKDVGRIAAIDDQDWLKRTGDNIGHFGLFECIDDQRIADKLLDAVSSWHSSLEKQSVNGPFSLSSNHQTGILLDDFESVPSIEMPYNPPYYQRLLESYGMTLEKELYEWTIDTKEEMPERLEKLGNLVRSRNRIDVRPVDIQDWDGELDRIQEIYNDAWSELWGFIPLSRKEMGYLASNLKMIIDPELSLIGEVNGVPVAVSITVTDINNSLIKMDGSLFPLGIFRLLWDLKIRRSIKRGRTMIVGIKQGYRKRGIGAVLCMDTYKVVRELGWDECRIGWTLSENNEADKAIAALGGKVVKSYGVFTKSI